jgi:hypothetical protein
MSSRPGRLHIVPPDDSASNSPATEPLIRSAQEPLIRSAQEPLICSAKGCRQSARWALLWNNPRIHSDSRRKTWLACDDDRAGLTEFLEVRGFLREVEPLP